MKNKMFVVQINMKDGTKKFVSGKFSRPHLVKSRQSASIFFRYFEASLLSDYYWEQWWNRETMDTRQILKINCNVKRHLRIRGEKVS